MNQIIDAVRALFALEKYEFLPVPGHEGGRNLLFLCRLSGENQAVLRLSPLPDREEADYLAETEFVRYLSQNGAPVAEVLPSVNGRLVERIIHEGKPVYLSLFACAKGILLADNGYRYRDGAPLEEYFFNTGKTLGHIHRLSKTYEPTHRRSDYFDKYNTEYLNRLIPDEYAALKAAMVKRLDVFRTLPVTPESYGLVHFDFSDGNYHIDMSNGQITVFDFDNCMYCWYMFDLANLWLHGEGWCRFLPDSAARMKYMEHYFSCILEGYRSETGLTDEMLCRLPLFIDMVLIENLVDEFECCARENELPDDEDIGNSARCLIENIPYAGLGEA